MSEHMLQRQLSKPSKSTTEDDNPEPGPGVPEETE